MSRESGRRQLLQSLFESGVKAAAPSAGGFPEFPLPGESGRLIVLAGGKAAAGMTRAALDACAGQLVPERIVGVCATKPGSGFSHPSIELIEAGHPVPDAQSLKAGERVLQLAASAGPVDVVLVLLSGGASALWCAPAAGVTLAELQELSRKLLRSGAPIDEINCVRKHLSRLKGGRLARAAAGARQVQTLAISDVVGNIPEVIGSGPTVADPTTLAEAGAILARRAIDVSTGIERALHDAANETPKPGDEVFRRAAWRCIASGITALEAAGDLADRIGFDVIDLGDHVTGEARDVAVRHARMALLLARRDPERRVALVSGGELTVTVTGSGRGGPNQEYALALAIALDGAPDICALAADTDGCDGGEGRPDDPAGALVFPSTLARARAQGLDPATFLANNDSGSFFAGLGDLLTSGPTGTNVNDFRVILIGELPEAYRGLDGRPSDKGGVCGRG
jgi:hydroxypyruvate reductase